MSSLRVKVDREIAKLHELAERLRTSHSRGLTKARESFHGPDTEIHLMYADSYVHSEAVDVARELDHIAGRLE